MTQSVKRVVGWKQCSTRLLALVGIVGMVVALMLGSMLSIPTAQAHQSGQATRTVSSADVDYSHKLILAEGDEDTENSKDPIVIPASADYQTWKDAAQSIIQQFEQAEKQYTVNATTAVTQAKAAYYGGYVSGNLSTVIGQFIDQSTQEQLNNAIQQLLSKMYQSATADEIHQAVASITESLSAVATKLDSTKGLASPHDYAIDRAKMIAKDRAKIQSERKHVNEGRGNRTWMQIAQAMEKVLKQVVEKSKQGDRQGASDKVNEAYYQYYEKLGFEHNVLNAREGSRVSFVESRFKELHKAAFRGDGLPQIQERVQELVKLLYEDAVILDGTSGQKQNSGFIKFITSAFGQAFAILIREGLEALLVVVAIIAYLAKSGNRRFIRWIYLGVVAGLLASFALAVLFGMLFEGNGPEQEITEGVTALIAMVMLLYTSNWMLSKGDAQVWNAYIRRKTAAAVTKARGERALAAEGKSASADSEVLLAHSGGSGLSVVGAFSLAALSFLAVFREGAETVLFLESIYTMTRDPRGIWLGIAAASLVLIALYVIIRFTSVKIPLQFFFRTTSLLMAILVIIFAGSGVHALIEGNLLPGLYLNGWPTRAFLGLYPFVETLVAQAIALLLVILSFGMCFRKARRARLHLEDDESMVGEVESAQTSAKMTTTDV